MIPETIADFVQEHATLFGWIGGASLLIMLIGIIGLPLLAVLIPPDALRRHFDRPIEHAGDWRSQHPVLRWGLRISKNIFGAILAIAGLLMLVLPGQGILTLVAAFVLLDIPGKRRLERRLLTSPRLLKPVNALRTRFGKATLLAPHPRKSPSGSDRT